MPFVTTQPEMLTEVANVLQGIDRAMAVRNTLAAAPTISVIPAGADRVSALLASQFGAHAALYQAVSAQATAMRQLVTAHVIASS
jgi:hypothetical protein